MNQETGHVRASRLAQARQTRDDLRTLGEVSAPESIAERALARVGLMDWFAMVGTPLGVVYIAWNDNGLSLVSHADSAVAFCESARAALGRGVTAGEAPDRLAAGVRAWLEGNDHAPLTFDLARLTPFERAVLMKTREIPHGEVRPYGWIAREIGRPHAVRAVGTALARNPTPIFIPCHRVVRSDGHLGNYSMGGRLAKQTILRAEGVNVDALERLAAGGLRYIGSLSGDSYCYPTCHSASRIDAADLVAFADAVSAQAAGYEPCNLCRPPAALLAG